MNKSWAYFDLNLVGKQNSLNFNFALRKRKINAKTAGKFPFDAKS